MALSDKFTKAKTIRKGPPCSVGVLLSSMTKDDQAALIAAMADDSIQSAVIWRVLIDEGHEISDHPINRHRRGLCKCSLKDLPS